MITKEEMIPLLVQACPDFAESWSEFLTAWKGEATGLPYHVVLGEFSRHLVSKLENSETGNITVIFVTAEKLLAEGDNNVRDYAITGILENIQNANLHKQRTKPEDFRSYLLPISEQAWNDLNKCWELLTL